MFVKSKEEIARNQDSTSTLSGSSSAPATTPTTTTHHGVRTSHDVTSHDAHKGRVLIPRKSRGVVKMEHLARRINTKYLVWLYGGFALLAYVMSLDQYTNGAYLTQATSTSFDAHSTLATISAIQAVFQAVSQPPIAKIADVAGRVEAYVRCSEYQASYALNTSLIVFLHPCQLLCVLLYAVGYAIVAAAPSVYVYAVGDSIHILGITGLFLLQAIIIADISSTRNRVFWSIFPSLPGVINVWVSGDISGSVLSHTSWRWGIGMFCILIPVMALPIIFTLGIGMRNHRQPSIDESEVAREESEERERRGLVENRGWWNKSVGVFWSLDLIGLLLLVAGAGMVLVTVTIANGLGSNWSDAHCIALLVVGGLCCIAFVLYERYFARHPLIPFSLLSNRTVIAALVIALFHPMASGAVQSYFYTFLYVAANQSIQSATRISSISSFSGTLCAVVVGVLVRYTRHLNYFVVFGAAVDVLSYGLMVRLRQSTNSQAELAIVQVIRGFGEGCIGFPVQAAIQMTARHEHVAAITAGYLTIYYLSGGVGAAIGGGIWTNLLPAKLQASLPADLAAEAYEDPISFIGTYPVGTPQRTALARGQDETQRIIVIVGCCLAVVGLVASCFLENKRLGDERDLVEGDQREGEGRGEEVEKRGKEVEKSG
ncbi:BQ5605_C047g12317 [Microbotryum silenes-dioicae]|uniref:BQ5605_C047g12317 protein n=1 Tax=Microbotryum silenes-dioicae TaxID=796604 RepID=A0A2X0MPY7_9BASI|nr:BQ5605_C047g12317 [Microbotryum silenes-dioicae]